MARTNVVKQLRQSKGLSIRQLAEISGISKSKLQGIETHKSNMTKEHEDKLLITFGLTDREQLYK